jgi:hypothetical protein
MQQRKAGRHLFETFVIETNMASLIDRDTREWERLRRERKASDGR